MKRISTLLLLGVLFVHSAFGQCSLPKPTNVTAPAINSCTVQLAWTPVSGTIYYKVKSKASGATKWTVIADHLTNPTYIFTGLSAKTTYAFAVAAYCSNNRTAGFTQLKNIKTSACSIPLSPAANSITSNSAALSWTPQCNASNFKVRYKLSVNITWIKVSNIAATSYNLTGLSSSSAYDFEIQTSSGTDTSAWTAKVSFTTSASTVTTTAKPNVVLIVLDDARYDNYIPNGGPSWFPSPSVTRIATEGANFVYTFPTTSECAPSRVSFYTGLYASHHGAVDNLTRARDGLPLIQQILKDNGYYTGFVGKYGQFQGDPVGFTWWATSDKNDYVNTTYSINGGPDTVIQGHITDVYQNLAMSFLNSVPTDKHFMLMFFTRVPHGPTVPRDQDLSLYLDDSMPFPNNFNKYTNNFPSYFYPTHNWNYSVAQTDSMRLIEFQSLAGVEDNVTAFMNWLDQRGILDSTLIIFTSDNGFLKGEHKLAAKLLAQEESIRIPLFIRYPAWFAPNTVYTDKMAANIDIAPTILDAVGIPDTFHMDGISLRELATNQIQKTYFLYQYSGELGDPTIRALRSNQYIYVKHYCNTVTEEFYDLVNDPKENVNQINKASYATLIASYRTKLDSMRTAVGDYNPTNVNCYLSNPQSGKEGDDNEHESVNDRVLRLWPNPAENYFLVNFNEAGNKEDIEIQVTNILGQIVYSKQVLNTDVLSEWVPCHQWTPGVYIVNLKKGDQSYSGKMIVGR